jgi:hypothetical protein
MRTTLLALLIFALTHGLFAPTIVAPIAPRTPVTQLPPTATDGDSHDGAAPTPIVTRSR